MSRVFIFDVGGVIKYPFKIEDFYKKLEVKESFDVFRLQFNTRDEPAAIAADSARDFVASHAHLREAFCPQKYFAVIDRLELFFRDRLSIRNSGRETCKGRLLPYG